MNKLEMSAWAAGLALLATVSSAVAESAPVEITSDAPRARVTGIGGVFFLARNSSKELSAWYAEHLGMKLESFGGAVLSWSQDQAEDGGITVWATGSPDSKWFSPSQSQFMINYRVDDLERLIAQLKAADIELVAGPEYHENGVFAWLLDPDGNKIELWEPLIWDDKNKR